MLQHLPKVKKIILIIFFIIKVSTPIYGQPCIQGDVLGVGDNSDMCDILKWKIEQLPLLLPPFAHFPYIFHFTKNNFWSYNLLKASFRDGGKPNEI